MTNFIGAVKFGDRLYIDDCANMLIELGKCQAPFQGPMI
jgi:hypothetical protein